MSILKGMTREVQEVVIQGVQEQIQNRQEVTQLGKRWPNGARGDPIGQEALVVLKAELQLGHCNPASISTGVHLGPLFPYGTRADPMSNPPNVREMLAGPWKEAIKHIVHLIKALIRISWASVLKLTGLL